MICTHAADGLNINCAQWFHQTQLGLENRDIVSHRLAQTNAAWYRRDLKAHFGCVNALGLSHDETSFASGGDDQRVLIWNLTQAMTSEFPHKVSHCMELQHNSNVLCLDFNESDELLLSGGNDGSVIIHDVKSGRGKDTYLVHSPVYNLSADPINEKIFAVACHDGQALIYDMRVSVDPFCVTKAKDSMHTVLFNPAVSRYLATASCQGTANLWDLRNCKEPVLVYKKPAGVKKYEGMSLAFNSQGNRLLMIGRRCPPVLYNTQSQRALHQFHNSGYYNGSTIKSCCFVGSNDEYVATGSDSYNLYIWKIPEQASADTHYISEAHSVLTGHRSVVNQVRYSKTLSTLITSGVEKIIKAWSVLPISDVMSCDERKVYTQNGHLSLLRSPHSSDPFQSMDEDPRMLAFFDSIVQRDLQDSNSSDEERKFPRQQQNRSQARELVDFASNFLDMQSSDTETDEDMARQSPVTGNLAEMSFDSDSSSSSEHIMAPFSQAFVAAVLTGGDNSNTSNFETMSEVIIRKQNKRKKNKSRNSLHTLLNSRKCKKTKDKQEHQRVGQILLPGEEGEDDSNTNTNNNASVSLPNRRSIDPANQLKLANLRKSFNNSDGEGTSRADNSLYNHRLHTNDNSLSSEEECERSRHVTFDHKKRVHRKQFRRKPSEEEDD